MAHALRSDLIGSSGGSFHLWSSWSTTSPEPFDHLDRNRIKGQRGWSFILHGKSIHQRPGQKPCPGSCGNILATIAQFAWMKGKERKRNITNIPILRLICTHRVYRDLIQSQSQFAYAAPCAACKHSQGWTPVSCLGIGPSIRGARRDNVGWSSMNPLLL